MPIVWALNFGVPIQGMYPLVPKTLEKPPKPLTLNLTLEVPEAGRKNGGGFCAHALPRHSLPNVGNGLLLKF